MKSNIVDTLENFFLCTYMPIKAYKLDGTLIHSVGYDEKLDKLFNSDKLYKEAKDILSKKDDENFVVIDYLDSTKFIVSTICKCKPDKGFFLIGPYTSERPQNCIPNIISLLHSISIDINFPEIKVAHHKETYSFYVKKALDYIDENYYKSISLDDISKYLKINKCYFCSLFKSETKNTYSQYLNMVRVEKSKELMLKEDLTLLDIALEVGFNNQNYFNMTFKKFTDMTPLEFRKGSSFKNKSEC